MQTTAHLPTAGCPCPGLLLFSREGPAAAAAAAAALELASAAVAAAEEESGAGMMVRASAVW